MLTDITDWLGSPEYLRKIETLHSNIVRKSDLAQNESETSSIFERELYFFLRRELGIDLEISKEEHVGRMTHTFKGLQGRKSGHGRIDAVINNLIIEYKHRSKLSSESDKSKAILQVQNYLDVKKQEEGTEYDAILTDGLHISYFSFLGSTISHTPLRRFAVSTHYRFRNRQLKTSRYKVEDIPQDGWDFDTRYIYPIVEGPCVKPFEYDTGNNYHIIPYEEDNTQMPVPMAKLYEQCPSLATYFANHKLLLDQQSEKSKTMHRGNEFYALSKIGPYTFAPYMVAARDNSTFCASVIHPTLTPWGERKQSVCVKHTIIISQDSDGNFISEDEAHYINGILNSSIVRAYIHSTFKTNGFSLKKSHLFLPKYDAGNPTHAKLSELSKRATAHAEEREHLMDELTEEYLKLCRIVKTIRNSGLSDG